LPNDLQCASVRTAARLFEMRRCFRQPYRDRWWVHSAAGGAPAI